MEIEIFKAFFLVILAHLVLGLKGRKSRSQLRVGSGVYTEDNAVIHERKPSDARSTLHVLPLFNGWNVVKANCIMYFA